MGSFHSLFSGPNSRLTTDPDLNTHQNNGESQSILLSLPTELLVRMISSLSVRDKTKLLYVSRRLRSVMETPSLWREFVWPYYHTGDEGYVNNVLKLCGQHVKRLSFLDHKTPPSRLVTVMGYCNNLIELSLPTTKLDSELLKTILFQVIDLQRLDVQCQDSFDIKQLLEIVGGDIVNLKVLTIRFQPNNSFDFPPTMLNETASWLDYWISKGLVPQRLNIVFASPLMLRDGIMYSWNNAHSKCTPHHTGHIEVYSSFRAPLNLFTVLPKFQLDFGHAATPPYVKPNSVGLLGLDDYAVTWFTGKIHAGSGKVARKTSPGVVYIAEEQLFNGNYDSWLLLEFDVSDCELCPEDLEQLAVACPNLQRLSLMYNDECLTSLQGLRTIASTCHNLQGLNLLGIQVRHVESHVLLWEILSDMKLTHLAVEVCALLTTENDKLQLIVSFQKCTSLRAIELWSTQCDRECRSLLADGSISVLSHFPSLIHCVLDVSLHSHYITGLQDILTSCKELKYLHYSHDLLSQSLFVLCNTNLQQLYIESYTAVISSTFMSTISAHGGLVHVVLNVKSVTSEGVAILVANSPNLITIHIVVNAAVHGDKAIRKLETKIKRMFCHRHLFTSGSFTIERVSLMMHYEISTRICVKQRYYTDLFSLWT